MNKYKIDYNRYGYENPYALFAKLKWWHKWEQIASFKTKEEASEAVKKYLGLPIWVN